MDLHKIIISRTDSIGDVILTLPVAGILKEKFPEAEIVFLGKDYTRDIVEASCHIDQFIDWEEIQKHEPSRQAEIFREMQADAIIHVFPVPEIAYLAKKVGIGQRIGTTGRLFHYFTCNSLVPISRRRSSLHEAQLNIRLLKPFSIKTDLSKSAISDYYGLLSVDPLPDQISKQLTADRFNLIMHPKSKGSAREWGIDNFGHLIEMLTGDHFRIFITGTKEEGEMIKRDLLDKYPEIIDMTGKLTLKQLVGFINGADGLIAASTGPLHLAAALGKVALGLYPPIRPMHPGRWAPLGPRAGFLVENKECTKCRKMKRCECMENINPEAVKNKLLSLIDG